MIVVPDVVQALGVLLVEVEHLPLAIFLHRLDHLPHAARALRSVDVPKDYFAHSQPEQEEY